MRDVVQKTIMDQARGLMVVPVWKNQPGFWALGGVTIDWWDLPPGIPIYQDNLGVLYPQRHWTTRVILFDALAQDSNPLNRNFSEARGRGKTLDLENMESWFQKHVSDLSPTATENRESRSIRGVIESDLEHHKAAVYRQKLQTELADTLVFPDKPLSNAEAREPRGDDGIHVIHLK